MEDAVPAPLPPRALPVPLERVPVALLAGALEHRVPRLARHLGPRGVEVEAGGLPHALEELEVNVREQEPSARGLGDRQRALAQGERRVADDRCLGGGLEHAESAAGPARTVRGVEGEQARFKLRQLTPRLRADALGRPGPLVVHPDGHDLAAPKVERLLHGVPQTAGLGRVGLEPVHDDLHRVALVALQLGSLLEADDLTVHPRSHEAPPLQVLEEGAEGALAILDQGGRHHELLPRVRGEQLLHHGLRCPGLHREIAPGAVGHPGSGVEHAQMVHDLGQGADGGAVAPRDALLVHGDRGGEPLDRIHVRLLQPAEELPGVGRERLEEAALPLTKEGVEGQRGLARAGHAGHGHERPPGQGHVH